MRLSRLIYVSISLIAIGLIFTGQSVAKLDMGTVAGMWLFDDAKGNFAKDSSGNGLEGEVKGGAKWVDGQFGKALEFDGKSGFVEIPKHENPTVAITLTAWVKSLAATWNSHGWILEKRDAFIIHPNGGTSNVSFCVVNGGPWNLPKTWDAGAATVKDITSWHMYTCTFDSKTGKWCIYVDGKLASSMDINKAALALDNGPIHIGWDEAEATRFGNAVIDEVAVFNVALEEADINSIMKNGLGGTFLAVEPNSKLSTTWSSVKTQY